MTVESKILSLDLGRIPAASSTVGEELTNHAAWQRMVSEAVPPQFAASFDLALTKRPAQRAVLTEAGQSLVGLPHSPGLFSAGHQRDYVFSHFKQVPIDTSYINSWTEDEGSFVNLADVLGENEQGSDLTSWEFTTGTLGVKKVFSLAKISDEVFGDFPRIVGFVNERLLESLALRLDIELVNGSGLGNHLKGILSSSPTVLARGAVLRNDILLTAISRVRSIGGGVADLIIANPADVLVWQQEKAVATGNYLGGNPAQFTDVSKPLYQFAGCDVVSTDAITSGNVLVLDSRGGLLFMRRQGLIETSPYDGTNFQLNLLTLRASLRAVFLWHSPTRAVSITGF